ncbi:LysR family transcriptional regulator [Sphingomonas sp. NFR15]|uniref:LysR family transcriptional regulator n=1 Tax=Sphingomonas sp. NFR15 TaxID=1566282 RepID=UPI000891A6D0|nr:LysR family transcriptional regulator [Sphingomonas sp. NFR15]SDA10849.1 DNA-binding transcriptional regulator, LysR family [Sphingomonas sp. NFR15]
MIERYLVRYFLAIVDYGSFSAAAQHCRVTQPTLSVGIGKLETALGVTLFERSNRHVRLTAAGTRFVEHARRIENAFQLAQRAVQPEPDAGAIRLGVLNSLPGLDLARMTEAALRHGPATFELVPGTARELQAKLTQRRIDVALTLTATGTASTLERPLRTERFGLFLPATHPLADRDEIAAEAVAHDVMIVRRHCESLAAVSRHFTDRDVRPHFALRSTNDERVLQMIAAGLGITVMPMSFQAPGVCSARLRGFDLQRTIGLAFAPEAEWVEQTPQGIVLAAIETFASPHAER